MKYQIANSAAAIASTIHVKYFRANLEPESASTTRNRAPIAPSTTIDIDASQARFSHLKSKLRLRAESIAQTGTIDLDQAIGAQGLGFKSASWSPVAAGKVDCL